MVQLYLHIKAIYKRSDNSILVSNIWKCPVYVIDHLHHFYTLYNWIFRVCVTKNRTFFFVFRWEFDYKKLKRRWKRIHMILWSLMLEFRPFLSCLFCSILLCLVLSRCQWIWYRSTCNGGIMSGAQFVRSLGLFDVTLIKVFKIDNPHTMIRKSK